MVTKNEPKNESKNERYSGQYNRLFPMKTSVNTFIRVYLLFLLDKHESMYGKEMIDRMRKRFQGSWSPSHGLVYPILAELEKEELIRGIWTKGPGNRQVKKYQLTEKGRENFSAERGVAEKAFEDSLMMLELFMIDVYETEMYDFSTEE